MNPIAPFLLLHLTDSVSKDFLFSPESGASAVGDTPASTPFYPVLRPTGSPVAWTAYETKPGYIDMGGVVKHTVYTFSMDNKEDPETHARPLDDLVGVAFAGQPAIWYAMEYVSTGTGWTIPTLASSQVIGRGTVISADFKADTFVVRIREQTEEELGVPTTPIEYFGRGGLVYVESGGTATTGARITRQDHADLRGTGDQWFSLCTVIRGLSATGTHTIVDSPIFRVINNNSTHTLTAELKNSAGSWQAVGAGWGYDNAFGETVGLLVNYDASGTIAYLWANGGSLGSTVITSGIFTASAGTTTFYATPATNSILFGPIFFRHGTRFLDNSGPTNATITDRSLYAIDVYNEPNLDCALEFTERFGTLVQDATGNVAATLDGFADADAAWDSSYTGESGMAHRRPMGLVGAPFNARLQAVDVAFGHYSTGHEGSDMRRLARAILADGARLRPNLQGPITLTVTFTAANSQCDALYIGFEPAVGQKVSFSAGPNAGDLVVDTYARNPVVGPLASEALSATATFLTTLVDDAARVGDWDSIGDADFVISSSLSQVGQAVALTLTSWTVGIDGNSSRLSALLGQQIAGPAITDATGYVASNFLKLLGPEASSVTVANLEAINVQHTGWQGDGAKPALAAAHFLAKSTPSSGDYGPSVIYMDSAAAWQIQGADIDAGGTTVWTFGEERIQSARQSVFERRFGKVRVQYGRNHSYQGGTESGATPTAATGDPLAAALSSEWRDVTADVTGVPGSSELLVDTAYLLASDAQAAADTLAVIAGAGLIYTIELKGPLNAAEMLISPLDIVSVTWAADSLLSPGKKGLAVGFKVRPDWSAELTLEIQP